MGRCLRITFTNKTSNRTVCVVDNDRSNFRSSSLEHTLPSICWKVTVHFTPLLAKPIRCIWNSARVSGHCSLTSLPKPLCQLKVLWWQSKLLWISVGNPEVGPPGTMKTAHSCAFTRACREKCVRTSGSESAEEGNGGSTMTLITLRRLFWSSDLYPMCYITRRHNNVDTFFEKIMKAERCSFIFLYYCNTLKFYQTIPTVWRMELLS